MATLMKASGLKSTLKGQTYRRLPGKAANGASHKVHIWTSEQQDYCFCGKLHRDDTRLEELEPGVGRVSFCGRCDWYHSWSDVHLAFGKEAEDALERKDFDTLRKMRELLNRWDFTPGRTFAELSE